MPAKIRRIRYARFTISTKLSYEFTTYKVLDKDEAVLRTDPKPFAVVVLTALMVTIGTISNSVNNENETNMIYSIT